MQRNALRSPITETSPRNQTQGPSLCFLILGLDPDPFNCQYAEYISQSHILDLIVIE